MLRALAVITVLIGIILYYYLFGTTLTRTADQLNPQYDYIIIGAGSAGSVLAARLADQSPEVTVLLLEAGGEEWLSPYAHIPGAAAYLQQTAMDWQLKTESQRFGYGFAVNNTSFWPAGKVLGGTGLLNYMMHTRGAKSDYDRWASEHGCDGWDYSSLLKYFKKLEHTQIEHRDTNFRGTNGPLACREAGPQTDFGRKWLEAARSLGYIFNSDYNGASQKGFARAQFNINANGRRASTVSAYLRPAMKTRPQLHVVTNARATRISFNEDGKAVSVDFVDEAAKTKVHRVLTNREIIVSTGAVHSPQLLMLSGIGPRDQLDKIQVPVLVDSPAVGSNLRDRLLIPYLFKIENSSLILDEIQSAKGVVKMLLEYFLKGGGPLSYAPIESVAFLDSKSQHKDGYDSDIQLYYLPMDPWMGGKMMHLINAKQEAIDTYYAKRKQGDAVFALFVSINHPKSVGEVRLRSKNPFQQPMIDPHYHQIEMDVEMMVEGVKIMNRLLATPIISSLAVSTVMGRVQECENHSEDDYLRCEVRHRATSLFNAMGTCRMGRSIQENSVVDARLRVHGVSGLRVVDASVFPDTVSGDTNIPVVMAAEKAADMIKQDWADRQ